MAYKMREDAMIIHILGTERYVERNGCGLP
jgi:hypothetical protein